VEPQYEAADDFFGGNHSGPLTARYSIPMPYYQSAWSGKHAVALLLTLGTRAMYAAARFRSCAGSESMPELNFSLHGPGGLLILNGKRLSRK